MQIAFVCTGNTCRSPMAEGLFRVLAKEQGLDAEVTSCGLSAFAGAPPSEYAVQAAKAYGAHIADHRARPITGYMLDETDLFVCMTADHAAVLARYVPPEKLRVLGEGIPDPYGGDLATYETCAEAIYKGLQTLIKEEEWICKQ